MPLPKWFRLVEQVIPVSFKVTNVQGKLTTGTVHVSRMKQYYPGDEQPLDSLVLESEPKETHNDNVSLSDSKGIGSAIVNTIPKDPAESENSTKILDNTSNAKESLNWDTQNDHKDDTTHLETNETDVGFAPSSKNLPPENIYYIEEIRDD